MRCLFVTARPPWPGRRGDQVRTAGLVEQLSQRHDIHIVAQCWPGFEVVAPPAPNAVRTSSQARREARPITLETVELRRPALLSGLIRGIPQFLSGSRPLQVGFFSQGKFERAVAAAVRRFRPDVAVVVLSRLGAALPALDGIPVVLDLVDDLGANMAERAARERLLAPLWRAESRRFSRWDLDLLNRVTAATVVAGRDRKSLLGSSAAVSEKDPIGSRSDLAEKLKVVPLGLKLPVEPAWARSSGSRSSVPGRDPAQPILTITGNLGYFPTVDGITWFVRHVWPDLRRQRPELRLLLTGARPAKAVRRLAHSLDGIELVADPSDLRAVARRATVALAPLRSGSGTPIKILEAMADGIPVVTTPSGRQGLDDLPADALKAAAEPGHFGREILDLLEHPEQARHQAVSAWEWLDRRHRAENAAAAFEDTLRMSIEAD